MPRDAGEMRSCEMEDEAGTNETFRYRLDGHVGVTIWP